MKIGVQITPFFIISLLLVTAFSPILSSAPPISQDILIVDISGNGDYRTIKDAISNASVTDIIQIKSGFYEEHNLKISEKIELIGEDPESTIINCSGNLAFSVSSAYVDISNLQIVNTQEFAITILPKSTGCTISNCIINTNYKGVAIDIRSSYNTIKECKLIGLENSKQGIKIHGSYNIIRDCEIEDFSNGILVLIDSTNNKITNCNIINNENAIDIRINSNENIISGCNIYSNLQSIRIWQGSNNNIVFSNNFWKNDLKAIDENNNSWDNGIKGNYWDKYRGEDLNNDGVGDTPYKISDGNFDNYPMIEMILPDFITSPTNVEHISSNSDNTPSFSWNPSIYSKAIKGYYIKIDDQPEIFIGDLTTWDSSKIVTDGIHTFYVRAEGIDNRSSNYSSVTFSIDTTFIDSDGDSWSDSEEMLYGTDPYNSFNYPLDSDGDREPDIIDLDDDNDGYIDEMEASYLTDSRNVNDYPSDFDEDKIPDDNSIDGKYIGDQDDDNDGLNDIIETSIGSNEFNSSDINKIYIKGKQYYLIDISEDGLYDILYEPLNDAITGIEKTDENYLLDINGDGKWDYLYNHQEASISTVKEDLQGWVWLFIVLTLISIAIIIFYYNKKKLFEITKDETQNKIQEKQIKTVSMHIPIDEKKETVEMINQTKALLKHIQKDVEIYMEKLHQIEGQFSGDDRFPKIYSEKSRKQEISELIEENPDIDIKVDELIKNLEKKENN